MTDKDDDIGLLQDEIQQLTNRISTLDSQYQEETGEVGNKNFFLLRFHLHTKPNQNGHQNVYYGKHEYISSFRHSYEYHFDRKGKKTAEQNLKIIL